MEIELVTRSTTSVFGSYHAALHELVGMAVATAEVVLNRFCCIFLVLLCVELFTSSIICTPGVC